MMDPLYGMSNPEILADFGRRIRLARMERKLTQQMLAERAGLNRSTIRDIENGKSVGLTCLVQLLRGLELLDRLAGMLPGPSQSPVLAKLDMERKRVRLPKKRAS